MENVESGEATRDEDESFMVWYDTRYPREGDLHWEVTKWEDIVPILEGSFKAGFRRGIRESSKADFHK
jgi:hypothetical protein